MFGFRRSTLLLAFCSALALHHVATPVWAQRALPNPPDHLLELEPKAEIMLLGTYHFRYNEAHLLSETGQGEIAEVVRLLSKYRPTKIALEFSPDRQQEIDSMYLDYREGRWKPTTNEVYQLGFRLAEKLGHDRVILVDAERHDFFVDLALNALFPRREEIDAVDRDWRKRFDMLHAFSDSLAGTLRLREYLRFINSPAQIRRSHMIYHVHVFKFDGEEGGFLGTDFVSGWYNRNLRIFRNLQRITDSSEERILLIIGYGHLPILRHVIEHSPEYRMVEVEDYLGES